MDKTILVYNNHTEIARILQPLIGGEGLRILVTDSRQVMESLVKQQEVQLMLMDVELIGEGIGNGCDLVADVRQRSGIPIIIVSEQESETVKISALNAGADDYVVIGCNPLELLARVKSQLRRYTQLSNMRANINQIYKVDELEIDDNLRKVSVEGKEVKLTPIEYKILRLLVMERGKVLSIDQIYESIWQMQPIGADNTIAVHIRHIREKIERNPRQPRYLKVVWGTGYKIG